MRFCACSTPAALREGGTVLLRRDRRLDRGAAQPRFVLRHGRFAGRELRAKLGVVELREQLALRDAVALVHLDGLDRPRLRRAQRGLQERYDLPVEREIGGDVTLLRLRHVDGQRRRAILRLVLVAPARGQSEGGSEREYTTGRFVSLPIPVRAYYAAGLRFDSSLLEPPEARPRDPAARRKGRVRGSITAIERVF